MAGGDPVVAQAPVLVVVTLLHPVQIGADRPALAGRAIQNFATDARIHPLEVARIGDAIQVRSQATGDVGLQVGQHHVRGGQVLADIGTYAWQAARRVVLELVIVVGDIGTDGAGQPDVVAQEQAAAVVRGDLVQDEAVGAPQILPIADVEAAAEGAALGLIQRFARACVWRLQFRAPAQHVFADRAFEIAGERVAADGQVGDGHAHPGSAQGEPVVVIASGVGQDAGCPAQTLGRMQIAGLVAVDVELIAAAGDAFNPEPGVALQFGGDRRPIRGCGRRGACAVVAGRDRTPADRVGLRQQSLRRRIERLWRGRGIAGIATQGQREHGGVAALPGSRELHIAVGYVHQAHVEWRALAQVVAARLTPVVVAVVLNLEQQFVQRRLVGNAAEDADRALEHVAEPELAGLGDIAVGDRAAILEAIINGAQRVGEITSIAQVAGGKTQRCVDGAEVLVGDQVLAGEEAGAAEVAHAKGHFGQPA
ncbi:hypothetical protein D3C75_511350 [compost metagenome]